MSSDVRQFPDRRCTRSGTKVGHALPGLTAASPVVAPWNPRPRRCFLRGSTPTGRGTQMNLDQTTISGLIRDFAGEVLRPTDDGFAPARTAAVWNGSITRQPLLIVRPTTTQEVATALSLCRRTGTDVTVRGGGHSAAGSCVDENAVMIDLSKMNDVRVDPSARRVTVGAGASLADLDAATAPHGLAVVGGTVSHTGVAGLTLTGGMGWLTSQQGLARATTWSAATTGHRRRPHHHRHRRNRARPDVGAARGRHELRDRD